MRDIAILPEFTTVLDQVVSPCGEYYAACTRAGEVCLWNTSKLSRGGEASHILKFSPHEGKGVYSLAANNSTLLTGGDGVVSAWSWSHLARKTIQLEWRLQVPAHSAQVNSITVVSDAGTGGQIVVGCGDKNVYICDLETRQIVNVLAGHSGYVHSVAGGDGGVVASGGEDGAVKLWDKRKSSPETHSFHPYQEAELSRPDLGAFISCVDLRGEWLGCGGGPTPSLWSLSSLTMGAKVPFDKGACLSVLFVKDQMVVGGHSRNLHQVNLKGEMCSSSVVDYSCTYSLSLAEKQDLILSAGSSSHINIHPVDFDQTLPPLLFPV